MWSPTCKVPFYSFFSTYLPFYLSAHPTTTLCSFCRMCLPALLLIGFPFCWDSLFPFCSLLYYYTFPVGSALFCPLPFYYFVTARRCACVLPLPTFASGSSRVDCRAHTHHATMRSLPQFMRAAARFVLPAAPLLHAHATFWLVRHAGLPFCLPRLVYRLVRRYQR